MTRDRTYHLVLRRLHRLLPTMLTLVGMPILFIAGCDPATAMLPDEEEGEFDPDDIESQEFAITGPGLPTGCSGTVQRYEASYPIDWEWYGSHMRLIYVLPNHSYCWVSHHGRVYTNWASGGADSWTAVLRNDYYGGGMDRLEVLVPSRFWGLWYSYYRWTLGFSSSDSYDLVADLFWAWAYYN